MGRPRASEKNLNVAMTKKEAELFFESIELVAEERGLKKEQVYSAFEAAVEMGCKKHVDPAVCVVKIEYDESLKEIRIYLCKTVTSEEFNKEKEIMLISLLDAKKINAMANVGDTVEVEFNIREFKLDAALAFKNKFNERLRTMQKEMVFSHFSQLKGTIINAIVNDIGEIQTNPSKNIFEKCYFLELGNDTMATLLFSEALPNEKLRIGDKTKVYVKDVHESTKWPQIIVSRRDSSFLEYLFKLYIPEVKDGIIEIMGSAREAGERAKVAVKSNDDKVDPIGACVGEGGVRIKEIVAALDGEKVDLFRWSDNINELITNSLQPAEVLRVTRVDMKNKGALAIVKDSQLSLAIGGGGINVKLAVKATGWKIDIKSEEMADREGIIY